MVGPLWRTLTLLLSQISNHLIRRVMCLLFQNNTYLQWIPNIDWMKEAILIKKIDQIDQIKHPWFPKESQEVSLTKCQRELLRQISPGKALLACKTIRLSSEMQTNNRTAHWEWCKCHSSPTINYLLIIILLFRLELLTRNQKVPQKMKIIAQVKEMHQLAREEIHRNIILIEATTVFNLQLLQEPCKD